MTFGMGGNDASQQRDIRAFLEHGCELEGQLAFSGVVRLNGRLKGNIESEGVLIVGSTAEIHGTVNIGEIVVSGRIVGDVRAKNRIEIQSSGSIEGSIESPILVTHEGAQILGEVRVISTPAPRAS